MYEVKYAKNPLACICICVYYHTNHPSSLHMNLIGTRLFSNNFYPRLLHAIQLYKNIQADKHTDRQTGPQEVIQIVADTQKTSVQTKTLYRIYTDAIK